MIDLHWEFFRIKKMIYDKKYYSIAPKWGWWIPMWFWHKWTYSGRFPWKRWWDEKLRRTEE